MSLERSIKRLTESIKALIDEIENLKTDKINIIQKSRMITVPDWNKHHDWPSQSGLRYLIFHEKTNGFHSVVKRSGKRILIDEDEFFKWIKKNEHNLPKK